MSRFRFWFASVAVATIPMACSPYLSHGTTTFPPDRVIDQKQLAESRQPNVWAYLQDHVHDYYFAEDVTGRAVAIRSQRGKSSMYLASSDMPMVIIDGARLIDLDLLQQMPLEAVDRIEIMSGGVGTALEGTNAGSGVIYVHTRYASSTPGVDNNNAGSR